MTPGDVDLRDGLLAYWPGHRSPDGHLWDRSPEANHGHVGFDARWIWFTNPRAVRHVGDADRTYVGYLGGPTGTDIQVAAYDHGTGDLVRRTLHGSFSADDHTNPAVLVRDDGYLLVFWTGHNGDAIHYAVSERPEDVSSFGPRSSIEQGLVTYPNPVQLPATADAPLYLFYRDREYTADATDDKYGYVGDGNVYYRRSTDGGETWSEQSQFLNAPEGHYGMYFVRARAADGTVHFFVTDAERGGDAPKWHVMHVGFRDDEAVRADGSRLATAAEFPLAPADLPTVYDSGATGHDSAWVWDAGVDDDGNPAVVYATFPSTLAHEYRYARWDGDEWRDFHVADAGRYVDGDGVELHYSAGVAMDSADPDVLYACVKRDAYDGLLRLETDTGGRTWAAREVTRNAAGSHIRPVVPENAADEVPVLWLAGRYGGIDTSETVLRGLPTDGVDGRGLVGDGERGVSVDAHRYRGRDFRDGLSFSALVRLDDLATHGTLANLGAGIRLDLGRESPGAVEFCLSDGDDRHVVAWDGAEPGAWQFVEGTWDGRAVRLRVEDETVAERPFDGPVRFDEETGWTLLRDAHLLGNGFRGGLAEVRLYDRALTDAERQALLERASEAGHR